MSRLIRETLEKVWVITFRYVALKKKILPKDVKSKLTKGLRDRDIFEKVEYNEESIKQLSAFLSHLPKQHKTLAMLDAMDGLFKMFPMLAENSEHKEVYATLDITIPTFDRNGDVIRVRNFKRHLPFSGIPELREMFPSLSRRHARRMIKSHKRGVYDLMTTTHDITQHFEGYLRRLAWVTLDVLSHDGS